MLLESQKRKINVAERERTDEIKEVEQLLADL